MMKIALFTCHRDPNYGSMLQAYALYKALQKMGFDSRKDFYLCFDLESKNPVVEFPDVKTGRILKIRNEFHPFKKEPYFSTLKELLE